MYVYEGMSQVFNGFHCFSKVPGLGDRNCCFFLAFSRFWSREVENVRLSMDFEKVKGAREV